MNGYSKISTKNSHRPRSIDFSDFYSFPPPQTPKPHQEQHVKREKRENEGGFNNNGAERFGMILGRSGSISSSSSSSASGFLQGTVKRAFSMRRSSSVSERYCRIHDQYMAIASPSFANIADREIIDDDDVNNGIRTTRRRSIKNNKISGGKIFKACKRLLGL